MCRFPIIFKVCFLELRLFLDIRSGSFSQISETYMKESAKEKSEEEHFTVDSF
jgi:hypothetical protein